MEYLRSYERDPIAPALSGNPDPVPAKTSTREGAKPFLPGEPRDEMIRAARRKVKALLRSARLHDDVEDDVLDVPDFPHLPDIDHRHKRGKGKAYDTARHSERARSKRTQTRRILENNPFVDETTDALPSADMMFPLSHWEVLGLTSGNVNLTQAQKQTAQIRQKMKSIFTGRAMLSAEDEEAAERTRKKAYWLHKKAGKAVVKARQHPHQAVHMPKTGRSIRATKNGRLSQVERRVWREAQNELR